jgi:hypothetical protein
MVVVPLLVTVQPKDKAKIAGCQETDFVGLKSRDFRAQIEAV